LVDGFFGTLEDSAFETALLLPIEQAIVPEKFSAERWTSVLQGRPVMRSDGPCQRLKTLSHPRQLKSHHSGERRKASYLMAVNAQFFRMPSRVG
jgi:hypothetical protein